jgi:cysteine peptidase B
MLYKVLFFAFCIVLASASLQSDMKSFLNFCIQYGKSYNDIEFGHRFQVFTDNLKIAAAQQAKNPKARFGVTKFSDMTPEEFRANYLMPKELHKNRPPRDPKKVMKPVTPVALPDSFDWNDKGAITPVKDQQQCGSCWAFSATETTESYHFLTAGSLPVLSPQQIVDCDTDSYGCNGGWTEHAFNYVISAGGLDTEASYPYTAQDGTCNFQTNSIGATIKSWSYVTQNDDENAMQQSIYSTGPASICVDASSWQNYNGGVLTDCGDSVDHCVQLTGFSTQSGTPAWNVRNSWNTDWGVNGYIYLARGGNTCDIGSDVIILQE